MPHSRHVVDPEVQDWIEARASWVLYHFGRERILSAPIVLPTNEYFPSAYAASEEKARDILDRVCRFVGFQPSSFELHVVYNAAQHPNRMPAGQFNQIWVEAAELDDPLGLAATIAHELCHARVLSTDVAIDQADDLGPLTELLTVFFGLGVITANASLRDTNWQNGVWSGWQMERQGHSGGQDGVWSGWQMERSGHLTMPMYGYALALYSRLRHEEHPRWSRYLRLDVRDALKKSLRYFDEHGAPDLRSLRALPSRRAMSRVEGDPSTAADASIECRFCDSKLTDDEMNAGICELCDESIRENERAINAERQNSARSRNRIGIVIGCCIATAAGLLIATAVLERFGVIR